MKKILLSAGLAALLLAGCGTTPAKENIADTQIGIRTVDLTDENSIKNPQYNALGKAPGEGNAPIERSFENAPPMIPHSLEDLLPITADNNSCLGCHTVGVAESLNTLPVPLSHMTDLRNNKDLGGEVSQSRFNCTQCHVGLTDAPAIGQNNFKADFRDEKSKTGSNLLDVLNQGI